MNLNQLLYFSVTARHQHFTRAAEELFISQPSLSYAISSLEDELGVSLFEKKGRNVVLTKHGELFLTHVERALSEIQQGREALSHMITEAENRIEIAAYSTSLGPENLPQMLREFMSDPLNADINFHFTQCSDAEMLDGLKSMKFDIAFPAQISDTPNIEFTPLLTRRLVAIVPKDHPIAQAESVTLQELEQYPLLLLDNSPSGQSIQHQMTEPKISSIVQDHLSLLSLASAGFGAAICVPTQDIQHFDLQIVPISTPGCSCTIRIAHRTDRYFSPALERFIAFLKSRAE